MNLLPGGGGDDGGGDGQSSTSNGEAEVDMAVQQVHKSEEEKKHCSWPLNYWLGNVWSVIKTCFLTNLLWLELLC